MPLVITPDTLGLLVAFVTACLVLGCLRIIAGSYDNEIRRHDLRIRVHQIREEQKRRQAAIERAAQGRPAARSLATPPAEAREIPAADGHESTTGDESSPIEVAEVPLRDAA